LRTREEEWHKQTESRGKKEHAVYEQGYIDEERKRETARIK